MLLNIRIEGKSPLMLARFTDADQLSASNGISGTTKKEKQTAIEVCEDKLYRDPNNQDDKTNLVIPSLMVHASIVNAGKFFKDGKCKMTTQKSSIITTAVMIEEMLIPLQSKSGWKVDSRPVRNAATGGRFLAHRPCFDHWVLEFTASLDLSIISQSTVRELVDCAGNRVGIGSFRPDCKGQFGRFVVTNWEVDKS